MKNVPPSTLFAGFLLSPPLKRALHDNEAWKNASITWQSQRMGMKVVPYQGREYVGLFIEEPLLSYDQLKVIELLLRTTMMEFCPHLCETTLQLTLFSQVLVT